MKIPEQVVADVVTEVSSKMGQPNYGETLLSTFISEQPDVARFITAHAERMGGADAVMNAVLYAQVISICITKHRQRSPGNVSFGDLDDVGTTPIETLTQRQPALSDYIATNVEDEAARKVLARVALALCATR